MGWKNDVYGGVLVNEEYRKRGLVYIRSVDFV